MKVRKINLYCLPIIKMKAIRGCLQSSRIPRNLKVLRRTHTHRRGSSTNRKIKKEQARIAMQPRDSRRK